MEKSILKTKDKEKQDDYIDKSIDHRINPASITHSETDSLIFQNSKSEQENDFNHEKNLDYKVYLYEVILLLPVILGFFCYLISLEPCLKDYDTCLSELDKAKVSKLLTISLISVLCLAFKYFAIFHLDGNYKLTKFFLISSIIAFLTLYYDTGNSFSSHGAYNRLFLYFGIPVGYFGFYILLIIYRLTGKHGKIVIIITIAVFITIFIFFSNRYYSSCDNWDKGLKDSKINNGVSCRLEKPKICNEIIFDNLFDIVYYLKDDCKIRRNDDINVVKEYTGYKNITKLGYPRVENWELTHVCNYYEYRNSVLKKVFNLDENMEYSIKKNEVYVDFTKKQPEVVIQLKKNENLVKKRDKVFKENFTSGKVAAKNILFFFVDSMSRNHFKRKLPKVHKWLERFYEPDSSSKSEVFQFLKYHGVGTWTNINLQPFFFGVPYDASEGVYSLNFFKNRGYITGSTENTCSREFVGLYSGEMSWLVWDSYDHDFTSFFCDPNFYSKEKVYSMVDGPYCYRKKCLYGKQTYEYSVEYANQFFEAYKDQGKMFRLGNIDAHEGTGESVKYVEDDMIKFLENFEKNGHLEESIIFFFSDHGYTMPGIHQILQSEDHVKELLLPFMYVLLPKNMKNFQKIRENLKFNENMFITPYDIHNTLLGMLQVDKQEYNSKGIDLFNNKLSGKEGCKKFKIKDEWCKCRHDDKNLN